MSQEIKTEEVKSEPEEIKHEKISEPEETKHEKISEPETVTIQKKGKKPGRVEWGRKLSIISTETKKAKKLKKI